MISQISVNYWKTSISVIQTSVPTSMVIISCIYLFCNPCKI